MLYKMRQISLVSSYVTAGVKVPEIEKKKKVASITTLTQSDQQARAYCPLRWKAMTPTNTESAARKERLE